MSWDGLSLSCCETVFIVVVCCTCYVLFPFDTGVYKRTVLCDHNCVYKTTVVCTDYVVGVCYSLWLKLFIVVGDN